ncbi:hypothetical protein KSD_84220 [Ktedonobacter sp. SOSP1-85]|uniref:hypothetical protein n=1 Tax=Ktedonobacter sp. SOSP1-85 TaxID=2778367 RepID=UPI001A254572|nr:hypothetical protein [Ktedonobacter sp. SOSP1-85]GHO80651.1 hypothetical protein KSD_84220 [Ktedonobacter sp. SOSP1-85]
MTSIADGSVIIQTSSEPVPSTPSWFGEVTLLIKYLHKHGVLAKIGEHVRFARRRFGRYEAIDFLAVLFGYAISGECTLEAFYQRLQPFAVSFMALFERDRLPSRSALSRFLAALTEAPIEALRTLFLDDLLSRPLSPEKQTGGLVDREGRKWVVFDLDGTREAARQRALPQTEDLPPAFRRLDEVCAPGYRGRKRGQVVRTRTVISQAHSFQWLSSFGNRGNGRYREELRQGLSAITRYLTAHQLPSERALLRLDGQYGTGAVLADLAGFVFVTRGKDYTVLDHPLVQARLHLPPDQSQQRPESQIVRSLYDCESVPVGSEGVRCRVVVATHPEGRKKSPVGVTRAGVVYELFFTHLPQRAFTASDVVELYLHRGAFEPTLADEDQEIDPDRWCSHAAWGQECWQLVSQWVWNLRLELGHQLEPTPIRITEFAPAIPPVTEQAATPPASGYGPPTTATLWKEGRFSGQDFPLQPDGALQCPAGQALTAHERRREADGSLRVVYAASIRSCRPCPLREQCQWQGSTTKKPRQVSVLLHPLAVGSEPVLWFDWSRRQHRRACIQLVRPSMCQDRGRVCHLSQPRHSACAPFQSFACSLSAFVGRTAGSQRALSIGWPGDDPTVRRPRRLCHLARTGGGLTRRILCLGIPSPRTGLLLRVQPHGLFSWRGLDFSHLLLFLPPTPPFLPSFGNEVFGSARFSPTP